MLTLFLSSVSRELEAIRMEIVEQLRKSGFTVANMENFGARPDPPLEVCLAEVRKCDAAIVIVGPRYGSQTPAGDVSFTHEEYRETQRRGLTILPFVLSPSPKLPDAELQRLKEFKDEVGRVHTYENTSTDTLCRDILATLLQRREAGTLGRRFSFFQEYERFFERELNAASLFNHRYPLVGRKDTLEQVVSFLCSENKFLILSAPGGAGKSRLLLEAASLSARQRGLPSMRFVVPDALWTAEDIADLPSTPVVVVIDDAHRRADLDSLIQACLQHNDGARFLFSSRPASLDGVQSYLRQIESTQSASVPIELGPLAKEDGLDLARQVLTKDFEFLAERLTQAADCNPLVITVGGQCVADKKISPDVLDRTPREFKTIVLDRLLADPLLDGPDGALRRNVLDVLAAIGPVVVEDRGLIDQIAKFLDKQPHEAARAVGELEQGNFLLRRGRLARVCPDVLADHLLFQKAVGPSSAPTGFIDAVFEAFTPTYISNILANAAELDWRSDLTGEGATVLGRTWERIKSTLPGTTNPARAELVSHLRRATVYTPEPVFDLLKWMLEHRDAPEDPVEKNFRLSNWEQTLKDRICDQLRLIATHPDFTRRCVEELIPLASVDDRPTNPNPSHSRRVLQYLAGYDYRKALECQQSVVEVVAEYVERTDESVSVSWAGPVLGAALARSGESQVATRRKATIETYPVAQIASIREPAIEALRKYSLRNHTADAAAGLQELAKLLSGPYGYMGREVTEEELKRWLPEVRSAIDLIVEISDKAPIEIIRYLARRHLRSYNSEFWPAVGELVEQALQQTDQLESEPLFDLMLGLPREFRRDYREEREQARKLATEVAHSLWGRHKKPQELIGAVVETGTALSAIQDLHSMNMYELARALARDNPERLRDLTGAIVAHPSEKAHQLLPAALELAKESTSGRSVLNELMEVVFDSQYISARFQAANVMRFLIDRETADAQQLTYIKQFLNDSDPNVRRAAVLPLAELQDKFRDEVIQTAVGIDFGSDLDFAAQVFLLFSGKPFIDASLLSNEQIDSLLLKIRPLRHLGTQMGHILDFLGFASSRQPEKVVDVLICRILDTSEQRSLDDLERFHPIPIGGHGLSLAGLHKSPQHHDVLRRIRDEALKSDALLRLYLATLFHAAADIESACAVLGEWSFGTDAQRAIAAASLLRDFEHATVFTQHSFIAEALDNAARLGQDCYSAVSGSFYAVAIGGVRSRAYGEPSSRDLEDKKLAGQLVKQYASRPEVRRFYKGMVAHADADIRRDVDEYDEEDFE